MTQATLEEPGSPKAAPLLERPKRLSSRGDSLYWIVLYAFSAIFGIVVISLIATIVASSAPAWSAHGLSLIFGTTWNVNTEQYGALPLIVGTVETTVIALFFAVPIGVGTAIAIVEFVPRRLRLPLSSLVELLAAVPSVVYGIWGVFVLVPWFSVTVQPFFERLTGSHFPFQAQGEGFSIFLAGLVLFVMVLPLIVSLSRDVISVVPREQVEGALSVGATRWQTIRKVVLPGARTGIVGAVTLATARALGETIAVTLVIGNNPLFPKSLNSTAATLASILATEFDGSTSGELAALFAVAVILMSMPAAVNWFGRRLIRRASIRAGAM